MQRPSSEKMLKRLVADLAQSRSEDVQAVLEELTAEQQKTVRELLYAYAAPAQVNQPQAWSPVSSPSPAQLDIRGFSEAVAQRLGEGVDLAAAPDWNMTAGAEMALKECAALVQPPVEAVQTSTDSSPRHRPPFAALFRWHV